MAQDGCGAQTHTVAAKVKNADLPKYYDKPKEDGIIMTKWYLKENKVEYFGV